MHSIFFLQRLLTTGWKHGQIHLLHRAYPSIFVNRENYYQQSEKYVLHQNRSCVTFGWSCCSLVFCSVFIWLLCCWGTLPSEGLWLVEVCRVRSRVRKWKRRDPCELEWKSCSLFLALATAHSSLWASLIKARNRQEGDFIAVLWCVVASTDQVEVLLFYLLSCCSHK